MKTHALLHILLVSMFVITSCSQSPVAPVSAPEWSWSVFAISDSFTGVSGSSSADVYVLSGSGTLLHYDGTDWSASMPFDTSRFWSTLWCASPRDVFAVGYSNTLSDVYHYDGSVVSSMNLNLPASPTYGPAIHDLWGSSGNNVYAVGKGGLVLHYDGSSWQPMESGTTSNILAIWGFPTGELFAVLNHSVLYYDGTSWREILTTSETLYDIWGSSREDVYAVGANDAVLHYNGENWALTRLPYDADIDIVFGFAPNDVYTSGQSSRTYHFDGAGWSASSLGGGKGIESFWGSSGSDVYAVGYGDFDGGPSAFPSIQHFDGATWKALADEHLMPQRATLWAISGNDEKLYAGGTNSTLFCYNGTSWSLMWSWDGDIVSDIWVGPGQSLIALVRGGRPLFFDESGNRWSVDRPGLWWRSEDYWDVWASGLSDAFFVGEAGHIAHFDGSVWLPMESNSTVYLNDIWGRSGTDVYAVGDSGTVLHYDGRSWQRMETNTTENLQGIWGNAEMAVAVGSNGTTLHCKDGQWVPMDSPTPKFLTGVWGATSNDIYAAGPQVVLHYDGSRWGILSDTLGGMDIWGRAGDGVYMLGGRYSLGYVYSSRILRYGPTPGPGR